jgi:ferritin-like metal-binding protein YciE
MSTLDSLQALLEEELKDVYDAEKQLTKALPKLAKKATSPDLRAGFEAHLRQTQEQIKRIERAFDELDMPKRGKPCKGMRNLIKEGDEMIAEAKDKDVRDAVMIAAAQKVEHYEIASYGTICTWAQLLGKDAVASILERSLEEEKETDQKLTAIAESHVNLAAVNDDDEEEEARPRGRRPAAARRASTARIGRQQAAERARSGRRGR